jgi:DNA-directed RNA polymerase subunit RPC12/RpoP
MRYLPCKKCGSGLAIVKGSVAQCPYCGAKTLYMESIYSFKYYLAEILNLTLYRSEKLAKASELERRKSLIDKFYYNLKTDFDEYRHLIITKLDKINIDPLKLFHTIRTAGNFGIIIEEIILPNIEDEENKKKYKEFKDSSYIINKSLIALYYSYLAKNSLSVDNCEKYYKLAENNYQNIVDFCNISKLEDVKSNIYRNKEIYVILSEFTAILRGILNNNPKFYSDKLEALLDRLIKIKADEFRKYNLYNQIENIYQLERETSVVLEKVKIDCPLLSTDNLEENIIFNNEADMEKLNSVRNWIETVSERYQRYQRSLLKLHSGKLVKYLESYRTEFINYKNKNVQKFNTLLEVMILKALEGYNSEAVELLNSLSDLLQEDKLNEKIIEKFEIEYNDLIQLDELLKNFIKYLFEKPLLRDLEAEYYKKLISLISTQHSEFDKYILKYINFMFQQFEESRSKKVLSLEEQKSQFSLNVKPNLQKLIKLSFNLDEKVVPYPLFIDLKVQNKKLKLNHPEIITVSIENPNLSEIKDIKIYFFMSDSFESKLEFTSIKRLKSNEISKIKTKIIPKKIGKFLFMVMVEYQHVNKTFWMPSIKLDLEVERDNELAKYNQYQLTKSGFLQSDIELNRINRFMRIGI